MAASTGSAQAGELRHGAVGLLQTFGQSFALLALALGSATGTTAVAGYAGAATPLVYVLGGIASLCLASVIIRFTKRMASSGGLYTFISRGLNPSAGFLGGWLYTMGFAAGISFVMVIGSTYLSTVLTDHLHVHLGWFPVFLILMVLLTFLALVDIGLSLKAQLIAAGIGATAILIGMFAVLFQGGAEGVSLQPFSPSHLGSVGDLFHGLVFAFGAFIGFEAAMVLGEEAKEPLKVIPRAVLTAVLTGLVFYVFVTFCLSIGFGPANAAEWAENPTAYDTIVTHYVGSGLAVVVDCAVALDAFVASLAATVLVSRVVFAMAREGGLPSPFGYTHPRFKTPWVGVLVSIVLTVILVTVLAYIKWDPFTYFAFMATAATFALLAAYILVAAAGVTYFWRERTLPHVRYNPALDLIAPVIAIAICALTIYWSVVPEPPSPLNAAVWVTAGWLALGIVILVWMKATSPDKVARFGQTLGEEAEMERRPGDRLVDEPALAGGEHGEA
ncbi:MAG: APC family permease [Actinobacteria bacterium]|nr:APC family permease [Actinomycetota bacterium]